MKALIKLYIPVIILVLLLQGCARKEGEQYVKVHEMLANLQTYTATAEIIVRGNKLIENYVVKQYFKYPDRYRLVVLGPDDMRGKTTIYDGERIYIYQPRIRQLYIMESFKEVEESGMFPGQFAKNLFSGEEAAYDIKREGSDQYVVIRVEMPGGNSYRKSQVLYIDSKSSMPVKMEILDSNGDIAVTVLYREFAYNADIDEKLLTKDSIPSGASVIKQ